MIPPSSSHQIIHIRNIITLFVCISFLGYVHFQMSEKTFLVERTNEIVGSMLRNESYWIGRQDFVSLYQELEQRGYEQLSQAQCMVRVYLDVLRNERFKAQNEQNPIELQDEIQLTFNQLTFPTTSNDFENFEGCNDILTMLTYLNPNKLDFIYTTFIQHPKNQTLSDQQTPEQKTYNSHSNNKFCVVVNQFNTSLTKLRLNLNSVIQQSYDNYKLVILDNGSGDGSYEIAKVVLEDLKQKLIAEDQQQRHFIKEKFIVIKQEKRIINEWELLRKYDRSCDGSDYLILMDGRDELANRHVFDMINDKIASAQLRPQLITSSILQRKQLSRQFPQPFHLSKSFSIQSLSPFTFFIISLPLYEFSKEKILVQTTGHTHPRFIHSTIVSQLIAIAIKNNRQTLQIDQMLYVYDQLQDKDRNYYFIDQIKNAYLNNVKIKRNNKIEINTKIEIKHNNMQEKGKK